MIRLPSIPAKLKEELPKLLRHLEYGDVIVTCETEFVVSYGVFYESKASAADLVLKQQMANDNSFVEWRSKHGKAKRILFWDSH